MALGLTLDCPLDGLPLVGTIQSRLRGTVAQDANDHLHVQFRAGSLICTNGHEWSIDGELKLYRGSRILGAAKA